MSGTQERESAVAQRLALPEPDRTILRPERPPAPVLSDAQFNEVFGGCADWIRTAAAAKSAPVDFVAGALLATISGLVGNARWVRPAPDWSEPLALWVMLVGDPSSGKSPAMEAVLHPLTSIEEDLTAQYKAELKKWDHESELAKLSHDAWEAKAKKAFARDIDPPDKPASAEKPDLPHRKRIRIGDVTIEKTAELSSQNPRGLLLVDDELAGWLQSMSRYNGGGDRPFWLQANGGRSYSVDRKNNPDPIIIDRLCISVVGGIQPDRLDSSLLHSEDDGLLARLLTVYPAEAPLKRHAAVIDKDFILKTLKRLFDLQLATSEDGKLTPVYLNLNEEAQDRLFSFREQCCAWEKEVDGKLKSHIGKLPGLTVRMAGVLALLDYAVNPECPPVTELNGGHLGRACLLVGDHYRLHAYRTYGAASAPPEVKGARKIAEMILNDGLTKITTREIQKRGQRGLTSAKEIHPAIDVLISADWIAPVKSTGPGRPSKAYAVNPLVKQMR